MAVNDFSGLTIANPQVGIQITKVTDSSADWASVANSTYFYDKGDKLVHYKDSTGAVLEIFSASGVSSNIYTADGSLSGNRVVTMGANTINFSGGNFGINSASFNVTNPERLLVAPSNQINAIVAKGSVNSYMQLNIQNTSNGNSSSSDVVATSNNGNETTNYIDMGINGGNYGAGFIGVANDAYLYSAGRELFIGNTNTASTGNIKFFAGNTATTIGMTLTYQSRLGVGITSPTAKMHITNTDAINSFLVEDDTNPDASPFVIDNAGNVGIGITTPSDLLEIYATQPSLALHSSVTNNQAQIKFKKSGTTITQLTSNFVDGNLYFYHNLANRMVINSGGLVGIGINTPSASLHVNNTTTSASLLIEDAANPDSTPFIIDQNGNVGIGNTAPTTLLDVSGKTRTTTFQVTTSPVTNGYLKSDASGNGTWAALPAELVVAASDETTNLTTGTAKVTFRMPYAMTLTGVRASLSTAQTAGSIFTVDINDNGVSVLSTKLTIDNNEKTSTTAATPAVISDNALGDDAEITIDIDQVGTAGAKGLKVTLIGTRA